MRKQRRDRETAWVAALAGYISLFSFLYYLRQGELLLYGDAVAHLNIARRVFDSRTPGVLQLGTVWLPLPHLLMIPFIVADSMWRTGIGASIPSMLAYVASVAGVFRLVRGALSFPAEPEPAARGAAWMAALVLAANPNLIYMQATAMTEALYLALFIWAIVYFYEFMQRSTVQQAQALLMKSGACLAGAELTRYDGWFAAAIMGVIALIWALRSQGRNSRAAVARFLIMIAAAPALWLAYNAAVYRNPLEFANGPYSAKAIEQRNTTPAFASHPGSHNPLVAGVYFLKSAELNVAQPELLQRVWVILALGGTALMCSFARRLGVLILLWLPLPFYMLSIAYSGVPLFVPGWWPFSNYNLRYGLQLLPLFAVAIGMVIYFLINVTRNRRLQVVAVVLVSGVAAWSYASVWRHEPVCFHEAWVNSRTRLALEKELAHQLRMLPPDASILMYLGDHVGALQQAGIPLARTINEGNHRVWKQPTDPEGLWERALADPGKYADYAVAVNEDPVAKALAHSARTSMVQIHVSGQPAAAVYYLRDKSPGNQAR